MYDFTNSSNDLHYYIIGNNLTTPTSFNNNDNNEDNEQNPLFEGVQANDSKDLNIFLLGEFNCELTQKNNNNNAPKEIFVGNSLDSPASGFENFNLRGDFNFCDELSNNLDFSVDLKPINNSSNRGIKELKFNINNNKQNKNESINHSFIKKKRNIYNVINTKLICSTNTSSINKKMQKKSRKTHKADDEDNILRKLQVHYISFITFFVNEIIKALLYPNKNPPKFQIIDYETKKKVSSKYVKNLKNKTIGDIIQLKVSPKMKTIKADANINTYNEIKEKCPEIQEILQKKYIDVFKEYYFKENPETQSIQIKDKNITLSKSKSKNYINLIQKYYHLKEKIEKVIDKHYLHNYKRIKKPKFIPIKIPP